MTVPGFYLYTGDWVKKTRRLTLATRGAWIDLLCYMSNDRVYSFTCTMDVYARMLGVSPAEAESVILELEAAKVADISPSLLEFKKSENFEKKSENFGHVRVCPLEICVTSRRFKREEIQKGPQKSRRLSTRLFFFFFYFFFYRRN